ncbi:MAG TPA: nucleoside-triphosphatase [Chitinophagaceae bacterium]|nr:nucleoside-triphosphatase [Chitinophagaceae bacterium]
MNQQETAGSDKLIYYRLIALWVLCEAMLGGIIHGFKIPVSGLIVGSCAVICICLIAYYVPAKGTIIKATIIVAIFKMMLSPQTPPPAYIAVFFQGLMGELLFWEKRFFRLSCLLLGVIALLESGLQRIIVLTIIYGNDLWKVINDFINGITKQKTTTNYSLIIASGYVLLHFVAGLLAGWWASGLPNRITKWGKEEGNKIVVRNDFTATVPARSKRKQQLKKGLFIVWVLLIVLYVQSYFKIGTPLLPSHISLKILLRSLIIILSWYFILGPLLKQLLHYWLQKKKTQSQQDIQQVLQLLPSMQQLVVQSWRLTIGKRGWKRMVACSKLILVNALTPITKRQIFILPGPIQTGKTTSLINWSAKRNDVFGILTPVVNGKRVFMNAQTREQFPMEAGESETEIMSIGKFVFSKTSFDKAQQIIREALDKKDWLVIDEIGPLEMKGEGFYNVLKEILQYQPGEQKILLVVRETMIEKVKEFFGLTGAIVIYNVSDLH